MFAKCPTGRPGTDDEVANVAELLMRIKVLLLQVLTLCAMVVLLPVIIMVH